MWALFAALVYACVSGVGETVLISHLGVVVSPGMVIWQNHSPLRCWLVLDRTVLPDGDVRMSFIAYEFWSSGFLATRMSTVRSPHTKLSSDYEVVRPNVLLLPLAAA